MNRRRPLLFGLIGFLGLVFFYFLVMGLLSRSLTATLLQFKELWFWILSLSLGFGIQVALYTKLRLMITHHHDDRGILVVSGSTSSAGMVACCAHHLVDVLPLICLSALSVFLVRYQVFILASSLLINILGIFVMIRNIRKVGARLQLL